MNYSKEVGKLKVGQEIELSVFHEDGVEGNIDLFSVLEISKKMGSKSNSISTVIPESHTKKLIVNTASGDRISLFTDVCGLVFYTIRRRDKDLQEFGIDFISKFIPSDLVSNNYKYNS